MRRVCTILIAVSLLVAGCGKPEDEFVGTYTGTFRFSVESEVNIRVVAAQFGQDPEEVMKELESMSVTFELKDDGTFSLTDDFHPQDSSNGEWTLSEDGKTITRSNFELTDEEKRQVATMGSDFIEPQILTVSEDGKMLTYLEDLLGIRMKMYFTRN